MIIIYRGRRGCGKSLTMVKDAYRFHLSGWKVYHNFSMSFGEYLDTEEIFKINKDSPLKSCVLVIDEIQIYLDSRRSMKKINMDFSNFIQQIRKRGIILLVTTQYTNTVDLRLRQHVDIIAEPRFNEKMKVCEVKYIDVTTMESMIDGFQEYNAFITVFDAEPVFKLYNTNTLI
mgnify:CR=1 FL=1